MEQDIINIFEKYTLDLDIGMKMDIKAFLGDDERIKDYTLQIYKNQIVRLKVFLHNYSSNAAHELFIEFVRFVGYRYVNIFKQEEINNKMEYLYLTCLPDNCGMKMEMTIE